jgi:thioredoxin-related protein
MKMFVIFSILIAIVIAQGYTQNDAIHGISFEQGLSWSELIQKAKEENKYIFVDCYATWCGPCKWMDKNVYPNDSVGAYMNEHFVSVRLQMDTGKQDDGKVRGYYSTAHEIKQNYHVGSYPTYLFFSPEGSAVHKAVGALDSNDFLSLARTAMDSKKQYYTLLSSYRTGEKDFSQIPKLLEAARSAGELKVYKEVALDCVHNYLDNLAENIEWTEEKIELFDLCSGGTRCDDKIFDIYFRKRQAIDSVMNNPNYADTRINSVIYRQQIQPILDKAKKSGETPEWKHIENGIKRSYGLRYAKYNVLEGQVEYYSYLKDWHKYVKYFVQFQEENGIENWKPTTELNRIALNNQAWKVFDYGNKQQLKKALLWIDRALSTKDTLVEAIDTKASILYKLGRKEEALALEKEAYSFLVKNSRTNVDIQENYDKMKKGLLTWVCQ